MMSEDSILLTREEQGVRSKLLLFSYLGNNFNGNLHLEGKIKNKKAFMV